MATDILTKIKETAMERHLSMKGLAEACGYSTANLYRILSGKRNPQLGTLEKLSRALGVPVEDLLRIWRNSSDD